MVCLLIFNYDRNRIFTRNYNLHITYNISFFSSQKIRLSDNDLTTLLFCTLQVESTANITFVERGSSAVECRTRNQVSPSSNTPLLMFRILVIFVLSIDAPVDSAVYMSTWL